LAWSWWQRLTVGCRRVRERSEWVRVAGQDWPDWVMNVEATDDFHSKQGRSTCRWLADPNHPASSVYLKRHYRLGWWSGLLATLWPGGNWSPAFGEWEHLHWGQEHGVPVPALCGAVQYVGPWFRLQSVLVIEDLRGMLPLHQAIPLAAERLRPREFERWKRELVREIARLARLLHGRSAYHKDLYLCHFFVPRERIENWSGADKNLQGHLHLIDFHRLGRHPLMWSWWQIKDLAQLLYSADLPQITDRDRWRFWRCYRGAKKRLWWHRLMEFFIKVRWRRYQDHNRKRERREANRQEKRAA
jgi:hypothetical protein